MKSLSRDANGFLILPELFKAKLLKMLNALLLNNEIKKDKSKILFVLDGGTLPGKAVTTNERSERKEKFSQKIKDIDGYFSFAFFMLALIMIYIHLFTILNFSFFLSLLSFSDLISNLYINRNDESFIS